MKIRSISDRRVAKVLAAFDRVIASPVSHRAPDAYIDYFMMATALTIYDAFKIPGGWDVRAVRALLVTYLTHCPSAYLDEAVKGATEELADIKQYETDDDAEAADDTKRVASHAEMAGAA